MLDKKQKGRVSLERAISKLGAASRTEARDLILNGQVKVHGSIEKNPARMVNPDTAHIEILGAKVKKTESRLIAFHKPTGVLTTKRDPEGRKTIYDLLPEEFKTFHAVGRLDLHTSGLLLLTNDTKLSAFLTDPKNEIPRCYLVTVKGDFAKEKVSKALKGIVDEGDLLKATELDVIKSSGKESLLKMTLTEGKNREIRRLCGALGNEVTKLKRISFGEHELGSLAIGALKAISNDA